MRELTPSELSSLSDEIRRFFIQSILENGGHFSANLGVVELSLALHYVFDFQQDKLVWDVGHQAYIHKLITGRMELFDTIRKKDGLSGFPKLEESSFDHFGTGHSSTSISAVLGMAEAAYLDKLDRKHIAVIGDGSLSGGMAFEALNNLGKSKSDMMVIVNDNRMGIDPSTGSLSSHLNSIEGVHPNYFENLGLEYHGPVDGHDLDALLHVLSELKVQTGPRILHIKTIKGKGYEPAEKEQTKWHSVKYVKINPQLDSGAEKKLPKFQDVFGQSLLNLAKEDRRVLGITPAMPSGSSMKILMEAMPERVFDVGIAEQHAVTFSAGLALSGKRPFCNIYSSFLQRAYDQVIHDVALQKIPVVFCLDRAGLVGEDGPTHHGVFDLAFLSPIPNIQILAPMDRFELERMMIWAKDYLDGPVFIRYPKGRCVLSEDMTGSTSENFSPRKISEGRELAVLSIGAIGTEVKAASGNFDTGILEHWDMRKLKPLDTSALKPIFENFKRILTVEDGVMKAGLSDQIRAMGSAMGYGGMIHSLGIPDEFSPHASIPELKELYSLDVKGITSVIKDLL